MTFHDWQQLSPQEAARELHRRIQNRFTPQQRRAVVATLPDEETLTADFARAERSAPLGGVPYFLKDLFDLAQTPTFAGSAFLPEVREAPNRNAAIVDSFERAGAVVAGKTHLHEFAYGVTGENPHYGDCEHPKFPGRTTGGSSSGSAAVVAAGVVPLSIGTDTGGSVRVPAAFCGLYGFRLTPKDHLISDAFPLASTFDTAGWFTADIGDMRTTIAAIVGLDSTAKPARGVYLEMPGLDADVAAACLNAAARFAPAMDSLSRDELLAGFADCADTYNRIVAHEAWNVHSGWAERFKSRYDPAVWERLLRVQTISQSQLYEAHGAMSAVRARWHEFFRSYDFLIMAATPFGALTKAECNLANRSRILRLTAPASLGGLPALTVPVSLPSGLTTGLQIVFAHPLSSAIPPILEMAEDHARENSSAD